MTSERPRLRPCSWARRGLALLAGLAGLTASAAPTRAQVDPALQPLQPGDVFDLEFADGPALSPDGRWVVFERVSMDRRSDRRVRRLWLVDTTRDELRPLGDADGQQSSPVWSLDGTRLAYLSETDDHGTQLHVRWMDSGQTAVLTRGEGTPGDVSWSPDGSRLAFTLQVADDDHRQITLPEPPDGADWAAPPHVIRAFHYRADGEGYLDPGHRQVFVIPAEGGTPRQVTHGPHDHHGPLAWLPGGDALVVSANRRADADTHPLDSELYRVRLTDGALDPITDRDGPDAHPVLSPDQRYLAWLGFDDQLLAYQQDQLWVRDLIDGGTRCLTTDLDRHIESPVWDADSRSLVVAYEDNGQGVVARVDLDGQVDVLTRDLGGTAFGRPYAGGAFDLADDGSLVFTLADPRRPADLALRTPDGAQRRLTALNEDLLAHRRLAGHETFWVRSSHDKLPVQAWLALPPDFDPNRRWPLLLEIHGGPHAAYGPHFSSEVQLYAAAGYVVLYTNPRGSSSYGADFGNQIHHAYPGHDYDDLMTAVDAVIARGYVDEDQLYVTGGSGGGVLSAWIVGKTDRFRAAVVAKPVINWASFVLTADAYGFFTKYWFPAPPWEDPEHYWARSPLSLVGNVTTPTMLLTGEEDHRTPISESEQYYQALQLRGVDTALVRMPGASHGIASRPSQLIGKVLHVLDWMDEHAEDDVDG